VCVLGFTVLVEVAWALVLSASEPLIVGSLMLQDLSREWFMLHFVHNHQIKEADFLGLEIHHHQISFSKTINEISPESVLV